MDIHNEIRRLKEQRQAIILAHNYTMAEVQDIADFIGDSLELSRKAAECHAPAIVFCGIRFMAETAKILSPKSIVFHPNPHIELDENTIAAAKDSIKKMLEIVP